MKRVIGIVIVIMSLILLVPQLSNAAPKLNKRKLTLQVNEKYRLKVKNTKKKIVWSSSKPKVAKVNSKGLVKAKRIGSTKITAKIKKTILTCKLKVVDTLEPQTTVAPTSTPDVGIVSGLYARVVDDKRIGLTQGTTAQTPYYIYKANLLDSVIVTYQGKTIGVNEIEIGDVLTIQYSPSALPSIYPTTISGVVSIAITQRNATFKDKVYSYEVTNITGTTIFFVDKASGLEGNLDLKSNKVQSVLRNDVEVTLADIAVGNMIRIYDSFGFDCDPAFATYSGAVIKILTK